MCEMKLGEVGGGKSGGGNSCQARKACDFLLVASIVNSMFFLSLSAKLLVSSEFIFWLKRPLTARIIQKAVSRTLKQSDIVLYAREMQV